MTDIVEDLAKFNGKWPYEQARLEIVSLRQQISGFQHLDDLRQAMIDTANENDQLRQQLAECQAQQGEPMNEHVARVVFAELKKAGRFITPQDEVMVKNAVRNMKPLYTAPLHLRQQLAECQQKLEMAEAVIAGDGALIAGLKDDLAECQVRERATREAAIEVAACTTPINRNAELARLKKAMPLIIQPQNSTALDTLKKQWQREALLKVIGRIREDKYGIGSMMSQWTADDVADDLLKELE
jgi:hypothetical protein